MVYDELFDWQKDLVNKYKNRSSYGLFLDCGTGKTPIGISFTEVNNCSKVIIISINSKAIETESVKNSWLWWFKKSKFGSSQDYIHFDKSIFKEDIDFMEYKDSPSVLLLNYESLFDRSIKKGVMLRPQILDYLKSCKGSNIGILIDESHKMKDLQSKTSKCIMKLKQYANLYGNSVYSYLLTGTPFTIGYIDIYSQLKFLGLLMTKTEFVDKYCIKDHRPGLLGWQQPIVGYKNLDELFDLIHEYAVTVKSEDVSKLPEKFFVYHTLPMTKQFMFMTKEKMSGVEIDAENKRLKVNDPLYNTKAKVPNPYYSDIDYPRSKYLAETTGSFHLRCRQLSIGFQGNAEDATWYDRSRLNELKRFLEQNPDNYVLFYNYVPELLEIYAICDQLGYNIDVYCGEIKSLVNYNNYSNLSEADKLINKNNIIIANFASGSTGMNWQEYNKCIIFSLPVYRDWQQGLKRIHRYGQKDTVIYHVFTQDNWLDKDMLDSLDKRIDYTEQMFKKKLEEENKND